jgi:O-acetyl-ADP-ribose deacetylase (regulator of RNase III)
VSVALPSLGCDVCGLARKRGAEVIFEERASYTPETLESVAVIGYGADSYETLSRVAERVRGRALGVSPGGFIAA